MQIRRIEIRNFRKLIGPVVLDGLISGVNIISGDNEEGKSTILQAIRAAFFQKHSTTGQSVKVYQPYNSVVRPEVSIEFEIGKAKYNVKKGFCVKPVFAELQAQAAVYQGAEAEERLRELFLLSGNEKGRKAGDLDSGMWGLLWMDQATAEKGLQTTDSGREGLSKLLETDVAAIVGGHQGRLLLKMVEAEYSQFYSPGLGREKGQYKEARENLADIKTRFDECAQRKARYERQREELAKKQEQLDHHKRTRSVEVAKKEFDEASKCLQDISRLNLELQATRQKEQVAKFEHDGCRTRIVKRQQLVLKLQESRVRSAAVVVDLNKLEASLAETETACGALKSTQAAHEAELSSIERMCLIAERNAEKNRLEEELHMVQETIESIGFVEERLRELTNKYAALNLDKSALDSLRQLDMSRMQSEARIDSVVTRISIRPESERSALVDEKRIAPDQELRIVSRTTVKLDGWGEIDIIPGGSDVDKLLQQSERCARDLATGFKKYDVNSIDEAQKKYDERSELASEIEHLKKNIVAIAGKEGTDSLKLKQGKLSGQLASFQESVSANDREESREAVSTAISLLDLRTRRGTVAEALKTARQRTDLEAQSVGKLKIEVARKNAEKSSLESAVAALKIEFEELSSNEEAEKILLAAAEEKMLVAQGETKLKELELAKLTSTNAELRYEQSKRSVAQLESEIKALSDLVTQLSADINAAGQAGLGEEYEQLEGERQIAERHLERMEKQARAVKLLYETLIDAERQAKEHLLEPVVKKLQPHLMELFSSADLSIDQKSMEITHLERNAISERYEDLSVGTREQLSVLTRLAVAQLLNEKGHPSLVILDDALVYSDEWRLKKLKGILEKVSAQVQIIILTCRPSDYADVSTAKRLTFGNSTIVRKIESKTESNAVSKFDATKNETFDAMTNEKLDEKSKSTSKTSKVSKKKIDPEQLKLL